MNVAGKGEAILGVDDDIDQLIVLQSHLDAAGYSFFGATGGEDALKLARQVAPRAIILDAMMPGMDGYETCRRLRLEAAFAKVPILLLTAHHTEADVRKARAVGASDFIVKPFDAVQLDTRLRHWLDRPLPTAK